MSVVVIGVDPGDSTGVAVVRDTKLIYAAQLPPADAVVAVEAVCETVGLLDQVTIACERYVSAQRHMTHQPTAQRIGGVMENVATVYSAHYVQQGPADARAIAPDDLLRRIGWWQTGKDIGARDANDVNMAVRHALLALAGKHASLFEAVVREA